MKTVKKRNDQKSEITDLKTNIQTQSDEIIEDDLASLQKRLQEAKHQRKKVELDAKLLEHRVNLLQNQEKIATKKVLNSKKKFENKIKENSKKEEKSIIILKDERDKKVREERLNKIKEEVVSRRNKGLNNDENKSDFDKEKYRNKSAVDINPRTETRKLVVINRLEGALKNCTIHKSIKASEKMQDEKRKRELMEKKAKLREELLKKLKNEENEKSILESFLSKMEKEESRLMTSYREPSVRNLTFNRSETIFSRSFDNSNHKKKIVNKRYFDNHILTDRTFSKSREKV